MNPDIFSFIGLACVVGVVGGFAWLTHLNRADQ